MKIISDKFIASVGGFSLFSNLRNFAKRAFEG